MKNENTKSQTPEHKVNSRQNTNSDKLQQHLLTDITSSTSAKALNFIQTNSSFKTVYDLIESPHSSNKNNNQLVNNYITFNKSNVFSSKNIHTKKYKEILNALSTFKSFKTKTKNEFNKRNNNNSNCYLKTSPQIKNKQLINNLKIDETFKKKNRLISEKDKRILFNSELLKWKSLKVREHGTNNDSQFKNKKENEIKTLIYEIKGKEIFDYKSLTERNNGCDIKFENNKYDDEIEKFEKMLHKHPLTKSSRGKSLSFLFNSQSPGITSYSNCNFKNNSNIINKCKRQKRTNSLFIN